MSKLGVQILNKGKATMPHCIHGQPYNTKSSFKGKREEEKKEKKESTESSVFTFRGWEHLEKCSLLEEYPGNALYSNNQPGGL